MRVHLLSLALLTLSGVGLHFYLGYVRADFDHVRPQIEKEAFRSIVRMPQKN